MSKSKPRLTVCIDEHLPPELKALFQARGFRAIRASETRGYHEQDESDYLPLLYSRDQIFVTGDFEFAKSVVDRKIVHHAGIVFIPQGLDGQDRELFCDVAASVIAVITRDSRFAMRGCVIYPDVNGVYVIEGDKDELRVSWARLGMEMERPLTTRRR